MRRHIYTVVKDWRACEIFSVPTKREWMDHTNEMRMKPVANKKG